MSSIQNFIFWNLIYVEECAVINVIKFIGFITEQKAWLSWLCGIEMHSKTIWRFMFIFCNLIYVEECAIINTTIFIRSITKQKALPSWLCGIKPDKYRCWRPDLQRNSVMWSQVIRSISPYPVQTIWQQHPRPMPESHKSGLVTMHSVVKH